MNDGWVLQDGCMDFSNNLHLLWVHTSGAVSLWRYDTNVTLNTEAHYNPNPCDGNDMDGNGLLDSWEAQYFGHIGVRPTADPDSDGFTNLEEYLAGTHPQDAESHPRGLLTIPNSWAAYSNNNAEVWADIRSTNRFVKVSAAEYVLDSTNGVVFGQGNAMSATNGTFNSTNIVAKATFTPTFPVGERHEIFLHAQGQDGQWSAWQKVILNPNVSDVLDKVQANYSAIANMTFTMVVKDFVHDEVVSSHAVVVKQKGPRRFRYEDVATGAITIVNDGQIAVRDEQGQTTPMFLVSDDDPDGSTGKAPHFYWDRGCATNQYEFAFMPGATNQNGLFAMQATKRPGVAAMFDELVATVDYRLGVVTEIQHKDSGELVVKLEQSASTEVKPGIWFHMQQVTTMPIVEDWTVRQRHDIETSTMQINSTNMPDSLFDPNSL
jgi:hypothetical protein